MELTQLDKFIIKAHREFANEIAEDLRLNGHDIGGIDLLDALAAQGFYLTPIGEGLNFAALAYQAELNIGGNN